MTTQPVIKLHNSKETEFEFDVAIQGPNEGAQPIVRFVVENVKGYNVAIDCASTGENKWAVKVPALGQLEENHNFHVEVIVDGYYFVPTAGLIEVTSPPVVAIKESIASKFVIEKPKVSATFESATMKPVVSKRLVEFRELSENDQMGVHNQTVKAGGLLVKAGHIMENGFEAKNGKSLDTGSVMKLINMVKESLDSISSKLLIG